MILAWASPFKPQIGNNRIIGRWIYLLAGEIILLPVVDWLQEKKITSSPVVVFNLYY